MHQNLLKLKKKCKNLKKLNFFWQYLIMPAEWCLIVDLINTRDSSRQNQPILRKLTKNIEKVEIQLYDGSKMLNLTHFLQFLGLASLGRSQSFANMRLHANFQPNRTAQFFKLDHSIFSTGVVNLGRPGPLPRPKISFEYGKTYRPPSSYRT